MKFGFEDLEKQKKAGASPVYVKINNASLSERMAAIQSAMETIVNATSCFGYAAPILAAVPAPDDDLISVGNLIVYGVSCLSDEQKQEIRTLLASFQ